MESCSGYGLERCSRDHTENCQDAVWGDVETLFQMPYGEMFQGLYGQMFLDVVCKET
jgi:hypothetical protein